MRNLLAMNTYSESLNVLNEDCSIKKPHVVILGAGASKAAFLNGDRNGKNVPTMDDLITTLELESIFSKYNFQIGTHANFESIFSRIKNNEFRNELEHEIRKYFSSLELPETPTLYDHLVLCLREKDVIATFNWDPFLWLACQRIYKKITHKIPTIFFLHGNVEVAIDKKNRVKVGRHVRTEENHHEYPLTKLIYPVENKNYIDDDFIREEWAAVQRYIENAYSLTIFGYGSPATDIEAKNLLLKSWNNSFLKENNMENLEVVDIKAETNLKKTWAEFFTSSIHLSLLPDVYQSFIFKYPRRSCEAFNRQNLGCEFLDNGALNNNVWKSENFNDLKGWFQKSLIAEPK